MICFASFLPLFLENICIVKVKLLKSNVLVDDRERLAGISKFNFNNRFWIGIADLFRVWILIKQRRKNE